MKTVQINITCDKGSTGKLCLAISRQLTQRQIENYILYSHGASDYPLGVKYQKDTEIRTAALASRLLGNWGFEAKRATRRLIGHLDRIRPDLVHLHNLHGHNADLELLLSYLAERQVKVLWTFHDCWAFTGYCPHYTMAGCDRWMTGCSSCPQKKSYSWLFDNSALLYNKKKALLSQTELTIITPSYWLSKEVKKSFLSDFPVRVIHNGIDLDVFKPSESDFRKRYGLSDKRIVLGVAFAWGVRKGLDVFLRLADLLPDDYRIVLVGTNDEIDRRLPDKIISIHKTADQRELAAIYTAADVLVNPTREENYPTVHMESLACGTPVVAFDVGGCREMLDDTCGITVEKDDVDALSDAVRSVCEQGSLTRESCLKKAASFSDREMIKEYMLLYEEKEDQIFH